MKLPLAIESDLRVDDERGHLFTVTSQDTHLDVEIDDKVGIGRMATVFSLARQWSRYVSSGISVSSLDVDIHYHRQVIAQFGEQHTASWLSRAMHLPNLKIRWWGFTKALVTR